MMELCMGTKNRLAELARNEIKNLLCEIINGVIINETVISLKDSKDPLEDFLRLEIFLEKLKYFDLMVTLRDCWKIDIERIISNSRNEIMSLARKNPEELIEKIFDNYPSEKTEKFKKYLDANLGLCKKIFDLSRFQFE